VTKVNATVVECACIVEVKELAGREVALCVCVHACVFTHICIYLYMYLYVFLYMYIYVQTHECT